MLSTRASGYALEVDSAAFDLTRFETLVKTARGSPAAERAALLREALGLWRGPALADLESETFAQGEIQRLEGLRLAALEERLEAG